MVLYGYCSSHIFIQISDIQGRKAVNNATTLQEQCTGDSTNTLHRSTTNKHTSYKEEQPLKGKYLAEQANRTKSVDLLMSCAHGFLHYPSIIHLPNSNPPCNPFPPNQLGTKLMELAIPNQLYHSRCQQISNLKSDNPSPWKQKSWPKHQ